MRAQAPSPPTLPIGVFDSGIGGLTVLRALRVALPHESLLYLGDTARVPYGPRSPETVRRYSLRVAGHLVRHGVKALVVACNTATTWALDELSRACAALEIPVVGVIAPGVARALQETRSGHVGVIGTEGTIRGGRYAAALRDARSDIKVSSVACPLFVALAEEGWTDGEVARMVAERYLAPLHDGPDTVILGCTHYPLLKAVISAALPGVRCVDSAEATAQATATLLDSAGLRRAGDEVGSDRYLVTDHLDRFQRVGARFLGRWPAPAEVVDLVEADDLALPHPESAA